MDIDPRNLIAWSLFEKLRAAYRQRRLVATALLGVLIAATAVEGQETFNESRVDSESFAQFLAAAQANQLRDEEIDSDPSQSDQFSEADTVDQDLPKSNGDSEPGSKSDSTESENRPDAPDRDDVKPSSESDQDSESDDSPEEGESDEDDESSEEENRDGELLSLADVIASVYRSFPEINIARQQLRVASGELLSAYGAFDTKFKAHSLSEPTGFYQTYRTVWDSLGKHGGVAMCPLAIETGEDTFSHGSRNAKPMTLGNSKSV